MRSFFYSCVLDLDSGFEYELECVTSSCLLNNYFLVFVFFLWITFIGWAFFNKCFAQVQRGGRYCGS